MNVFDKNVTLYREPSVTDNIWYYLWLKQVEPKFKKSTVQYIHMQICFEMT